MENYSACVVVSSEYVQFCADGYKVGKESLASEFGDQLLPCRVILNAR